VGLESLVGYICWFVSSGKCICSVLVSIAVYETSDHWPGSVGSHAVNVCLKGLYYPLLHPFDGYCPDINLTMC